jgi:hypothetical protein
MMRVNVTGYIADEYFFFVGFCGRIREYER